MATYEVKAPDGSVFEIVAPDSASEEDVLARAKAEFAKRGEDETARKRAELARGATLKIGPLDTGIALPQAATETLAGAGRRMMDIFTLGNRGTREPAADRALDQSLAATVGGAGADLATMLGAGPVLKGAAAALPHLPMAAGALRTAGQAITAPQSIGQAAAAGGLYGALTTDGGAAERLQSGVIGGAGAAALPAAVRAGKVLGAAVAPMTEQGRRQIMGQALRRAAGPSADDVAARLAAAKELLPGSTPTAAQAALNPGIAALERSVAATAPGGQYGQRMLEQNAARLAALQQIAGDEGQRMFFDAARKAAADDLYRKAFEAAPQALTPAVRKEIKQLMDRPAIMQAVKQARTLAKNEGLPLSDATSVRGLHYTKLALDDQISAAVRAGDNNKARVLRETQDKLVGLIEKISPDYAEARRTFAAMSRDINRMDVGQSLLDKLQPALGMPGAEARLNATAFARALRDADATAKKATGFAGARLDNILSADDMRKLDALREDLSRAAFVADAGRGAGSDTAQKLSMAHLASSTGVHGLPNLLSRPIQVAEYVLHGVYRRADDEMRERLAEALLNPQLAAQLMRAAGRAETPGLLSVAAERAALPLAAPLSLGLLNTPE